jgi:3-methyladenine DNA glycosylase AlkD
MGTEEVLQELRSMADPRKVEGMARFGINPKNTLGIGIPALRAMAKKLGRDHALAQGLWSSGIHEARLLAGFVDEPDMVTEVQMETWAADFDSWDVVDQVCSNLFDKTDHAYRKAKEWAVRPEEFVKRAGFVLVASLSVHDKKAHDREFEKFLPLIMKGATDERNFVKKAVNWALRQIGKRSLALNAASVRLAKEIRKMDSSSARWIASDALRELTSEKVRNRLTAKHRG